MACEICCYDSSNRSPSAFFKSNGAIIWGSSVLVPFDDASISLSPSFLCQKIPYDTIHFSSNSASLRVIEVGPQKLEIASRDSLLKDVRAPEGIAIGAVFGNNGRHGD